MNKVLGLYEDLYSSDNEALFRLISQMHRDYFEMIALDGKPEKGERKLSDDLVLVINELLEPLDDSTYLYRVALL